jgi:haloacid dehalogenase-like hydrolase
MSNGKTQLDTISNEKALREIIQSTPLDTPIIVDFDHTLFLSNTTEEYLNLIKPRWLIALILAVLDFLKPWQFFRSEERDFIYRDHFRVLIATLFFPWIVLIWKRRAASLAAEFKNERLIDIIRSNGNKRIILASNGYSFIIKPLLKHYPISFTAVLGAKFLNGYLNRKQGKLSIIQNEVGVNTLNKSIFITDSLDDKPVLIEAGYPALIRWPGEKKFKAQRDVYVPFYYTEKVKYPGYRPVLKNFLLDDIPAILVSITFVYGVSISSITATLLLYTAFICVYELGYRENDFVASLNEKNPTRSKKLEEYRFYPMGKEAWIWSVILSVIGISILSFDKFKDFGQAISVPNIYPEIKTLLVWLGFLVLVRTAFWFHNSLQVNLRLFSFAVLQILRLFGLVLVMTTNIVGASFLGAIILGRWMRYSIYRYNGDKVYFPDKFVRLIIFLFIIVVIALTNKDISIFSYTQVWLVVFWCILRGGHQVLWPFKYELQVK